MTISSKDDRRKISDDNNYGNERQIFTRISFQCKFSGVISDFARKLSRLNFLALLLCHPKQNFDITILSC